MNQKAVEGLRRSREEASRSKADAVLACLRDAAAQPTPITVAGVARKAGVSREFIHNNKTLYDALTTARATQRPDGPPVTSTTGKSTEGLRADRALLTAQVARQKARLAEQAQVIAQLQHQQQLALGRQLAEGADGTSAADTELRLTVERLMAENETLRREGDELRRTLHIAEADLQASRQAHREDLREGRTGAGTVHPLRPR